MTFKVNLTHTCMLSIQRGVNMLRGTVDSQLQTEISALTR